MAIEREDVDQVARAQGETTQKKALCCKIVLAAAFISSIPLWILFEKAIREQENDAIVWLQANVAEQAIYSAFYYAFSTEVTLLV